MNYSAINIDFSANTLGCSGSRFDERAHHNSTAISDTDRPCRRAGGLGYGGRRSGLPCMGKRRFGILILGVRRDNRLGRFDFPWRADGLRQRIIANIRLRLPSLKMMGLIQDDEARDGSVISRSTIHTDPHWPC